jgi:hypothetical protein
MDLINSKHQFRMHCYSKAECEAIFCVKLCASISGTLEIFELATAFFFLHSYLRKFCCQVSYLEPFCISVMSFQLSETITYCRFSLVY